MNPSEAVAYLNRWYGSHERVEPLLAIMQDMEPREALELFRDEWSGCDDTRAYTTHVVDTLEAISYDLDWRDVLTDDDRKKFDALPDQIMVWRGSDESTIKGACWSLDRKVAEKFARGHRMMCNPRPTLARAVVSKWDVLFFFTDRNESEVLLDPFDLPEMEIVSVKGAAA
ncbi:hypothetical protein PXK30_09440 [Phaeobacter gallaeciensis]|uniref:hypothetical protein n=1 Tax=Phaeobacter gallaeciensis TaxID=60890 RepID=UPI00237F8FED|nr:hypothetical protein [Phaeobacter gallaeciensis]MDE4303655.1 hypothetical protein [Phaeobacter gallaeciensis]MDE4307864.1 hypothetical protein [Phaeobacter gallaeciensis]MDE4312322.1 hypothetical protein [Phaeobacter gallaeciensis]MDE4316793.1 hypothetical protein [Phaeobacter gallaeciensis]MDE4321256.1 hypothetical protein [Phaeobacter gallaeciensis]